MAKKQSLAQFFASKGMRLRTWARSKKLGSKDMQLLYKISYGSAQGLRGRAKELKGLLEKEGFGRALARSVQNTENGARRTDLSGGDTSPKAQYDKNLGGAVCNDEKSGIVPCGDDKRVRNVGEFC